jgi:hypothetical protein
LYHEISLDAMSLNLWLIVLFTSVSGLAMNDGSSVNCCCIVIFFLFSDSFAAKDYLAFDMFSWASVICL